MNYFLVIATWNDLLYCVVGLVCIVLIGRLWYWICTYKSKGERRYQQLLKDSAEYDKMEKRIQQLHKKNLENVLKLPKNKED